VSININKGDCTIVKFTIDKTIYQLGDVVKGILDFSENKTQCYQVIIFQNIIIDNQKERKSE
jgi:hypothetical protein